MVSSPSAATALFAPSSPATLATSAGVFAYALGGEERQERVGGASARCTVASSKMSRFRTTRMKYASTPSPPYRASGALCLVSPGSASAPVVRRPCSGPAAPPPAGDGGAAERAHGAQRAERLPHVRVRVLQPEPSPHQRREHFG